MMLIVNCIIYVKVAKRTDLKRSHQKNCNCMQWWILTKLILVGILIYIYIYNHVVHLKVIQCYISIISQLKKQNKIVRMTGIRMQRKT